MEKLGVISDDEFWKSGSNIQNDPTLTSNNAQMEAFGKTNVHVFEYSPLKVYSVKKGAMYADAPRRIFQIRDFSPNFGYKILDSGHVMRARDVILGGF